MTMDATSAATPPAAHSGTFLIGGELLVHRIGFGAMRITGPGIWGPPSDPQRAIATIRTAVELGVNHIDTADAYGPHTSETLIAQALRPYPDDLVIATKGGMTRPAPDQWKPHGHPDYLRRCVHDSLQRLGRDHVDLYYLHRIDPAYPLADQLGVLVELQQAGKIRHVGISKVTRAQLSQARTHASIAAVQNPCNIAETDDDVHDECVRTGTAYVTYRPLGKGQLIKAPTGSTRSTDTRGATRTQQLLEWLLRRSPVTLPIPGTSSPDHVRENVHATAHNYLDINSDEAS